MLKHADTDNLLKTAHIIQVAVITHFHPALLLQASALDSLIGQRCLLFAESDAARFNSIISGGVNDQATPTATDVEQALAGTQTELSAEIIEFSHLGRVEALVSGCKIGA